MALEYILFPIAAGTKIAADNDGTGYFQVAKLAYGADGTFTLVSTGASAMPIQDGGNSITVDGTVSLPTTTTLKVGEMPRVFNATIQNLTLTGTAQSLTVPGSETHALIYANGASDTDYAMYWQTGATPTSTVGKKLKDHEEIPCASPATFKAINGSGTVTLRVEYYHYA